MRRMWKLAAGAALATAVSLAGIGAAIAQSKGTMYYLVPTLLDEFQTRSIDAIEKFMGDVGYDVVSLDAQNRSDLQPNQVDDVLNLDPSAVILAAVDFDAIKPGIEVVGAETMRFPSMYSGHTSPSAKLPTQKSWGTGLEMCTEPATPQHTFVVFSFKL